MRPALSPFPGPGAQEVLRKHLMDENEERESGDSSCCRWSPSSVQAGGQVSPFFLGVPFSGTGLVPAPVTALQGTGHPGPAENPEGRAWRVYPFILSFFIHSLLVLGQAPSGHLRGGSHDALS